MTQFYVYIYRDPGRKNEAIYVGKGFGKRSHFHLSNRDKPHKKENKTFMGRLRKMKAIGVEPDIEIINAIDEDHAYFMEECCIQVLGRKDLGKGTLLNHTDGGEGARNVSLISRTKNSEAHRGVKNPFYGKTHSIASKAKIAMTNSNPSAETRKKKSLANAGENNPFYGKSHSSGSLDKMSKGRSGIVLEKVICPHCGKEGRINGMKQWHFDKCKSRIHPAI